MADAPNPDTGRHEQDTLRVVVVQLEPPAKPDLIITAREAVLFLTTSASEYSARLCEDIRCEVCYEFVATWKSLYQALDAHDRGAVEATLEERDIRAPSFPQAIR